MRLTLTRLIVLWLAAAVAVIGVVYAKRWSSEHGQPRQQQARTNLQPSAQQDAPASAYADPGICASCHEHIAETYSRTGMARSFSKLRPSQPVADFTTRNHLFHEASGRHYAMVERG